MVPQVLDGIEIGALRRPWHAVDRVCLSPPSRISASVTWRVVLLEYHARDLLFNLPQVWHQVFADHVNIAVLVRGEADVNTAWSEENSCIITVCSPFIPE